VTVRTAGWGSHRRFDGARDRCCAVAVAVGYRGDREEARCEHANGDRGEFGHQPPTEGDCGEGPALLHRPHNSPSWVQLGLGAPRSGAPLPGTDRGCPTPFGSRRARRLPSCGCSLRARPVTRPRGVRTSDSLRGTDAGSPRNGIWPAPSGLRAVLGGTGTGTACAPSDPPDRPRLASPRALLTLLFRQNPPDGPADHLDCGEQSAHKVPRGKHVRQKVRK
jgi:hypothetical protein